MANPVAPPEANVPNLEAVAAELGLSTAPTGHGTYELILHAGLVAHVTDKPMQASNQPTHIAVCAASIVEARRALSDHYGHASSDINTVDDTTLRSRGVLIATPSLVVTAVHCRVAETAGIPCSSDCSPHKRLG